MDLDHGHSRDRISNLPDAVLCHILSFLRTNHALRTSILSRRWRHLWTSIPILNFDYKSSLQRGRCPETSQHFVDFVNRVLLLSDASVEKLHIRCQNCTLDIFQAWMCAAIKRKVEELDVNMKRVGGMELPFEFFTCKTFVFLELSHLNVTELPDSVWLPSVKILHLKAVVFANEDQAQKLFNSCPILEELVILKWDNKWDFNASSAKMKFLSIHHADATSISDYEEYEHEYEYEWKLTVDCPNLEVLSLSDFGSVDYSLNNLSALFKAYICVGQRTLDSAFYGNCILGLLNQVLTVKYLVLSEETFNNLMYIDANTLPTFHNVNRLELYNIGGFGWNFLSNFFKRTPNLEVLVLQTVDDTYIDMDEHWRPPEHVPSCLELHLIEIEMNDFNGAICEFEAIEYLLENAKVLKKMTIDCRDLMLEGESSAVRERLSRSAICERLSSFSVSSSDFVLSALF